MGGIAGGMRWRVIRLEARTRKLEQQAGERTAALEQKTRELQDLYEKSHDLAVLEERSRLARELHDAVTQTLFSASLVAEALPTTWERDPQEGRGLLQELRAFCRGALTEMRTLLLELRSARLMETRLDDLLRQLGEVASGREGIPVAVQVEGQASLLPPDVHITLYRIAQEALNNVVKHARARQVTVRLCYRSDAARAAGIEASAGLSEPQEQPTNPKGGLHTASTPQGQPSMVSGLLSISDDGRGFDPIQVPHDRLGLGNMQERAGHRCTVDGREPARAWHPGHGAVGAGRAAGRALTCPRGCAIIVGNGYPFSSPERRILWPGYHRRPRGASPGFS